MCARPQDIKHFYVWISRFPSTKWETWIWWYRIKILVFTVSFILFFLSRLLSCILWFSYCARCLIALLFFFFFFVFQCLSLEFTYIVRRYNFIVTYQQQAFFGWSTHTLVINSSRKIAFAFVTIPCILCIILFVSLSIVSIQASFLCWYYIFESNQKFKVTQKKKNGWTKNGESVFVCVCLV